MLVTNDIIFSDLGWSLWHQFHCCHFQF